MTRSIASGPPGPLHNRVLGTLPEPAIAALLPHLEPITLKCGSLLSPSGEQTEYAYFPTTVILSLQQGIDGRPGSEVALVGRGGMTGISIVVGDGSSSRQTFVHCPGLAYRLPAKILQGQFDSSVQLRSHLLRYFSVQMAQVAQNVACYRLHSVDQQVCRRLLMLLDYLPSPEVPITHELLAGVLGVRREAVTIACSRLLAEAIIQPGRGRIRVMDRDRLARHACECHQSLQTEVARLLGSA